MKKTNEYAQLIDAKVFRKMPKTVIAALAVSYLVNAGIGQEEITSTLLAEWKTLNANGIVPQKALA